MFRRKPLCLVLFILLVLPILATSFVPTVEADPEWLSGWGKRVKVTINSTDVDKALTDFPVLIFLSNSSGENNDDVSFVFDELGSDANRKKIAVTTSDGVTQCYVEIEKWDDTNEQAWLWTKVPTVSNTSDTDLYLYYDSSHANNTAYVGDPNSTPAENVWDGNFKLVAHMRDDPDTSHVRDSTGNDNDGTKKDVNEPQVVTTGQIDDAQQFDGVDDEISVTHDPSLNLTDKFTIELWFKSASTTQTSKYLLDKYLNVYAMLYEFVNDKIEFYSGQYTGTNPRTGSAMTLDDTDWHYLVYAHEDDTPLWRGYKDGQLIVNPDSSFVLGTSINAFAIGSAGSSYNEVAGLIDEVRLSNSYRSSAWVKACYETQRDHLLSYGSQETSGYSATVGPFTISSTNEITGETWDDINLQLSFTSSGTITVDVGNYGIPLWIEVDVAVWIDWSYDSANQRVTINNVASDIVLFWKEETVTKGGTTGFWLTKTTLTLETPSRFVGPASTVNVRGQIKDEFNQVAVNQMIVATLTWSNETVEAWTDKDGRFTFSFISPSTIGRYQVNIEYRGGPQHEATTKNYAFTVAPVHPVKLTFTLIAVVAIAVCLLWLGRDQLEKAVKYARKHIQY